PTTAAPTSPGSTTESTVAVLYPKDFEDICLQPIAILTAAFFAAMVPIQGLALFAAFTKLANTFNPSKINAQTRHKQRMKRVMKK
ncbi:unnamed protein product, partial [Adineta ricciae]